MNAETLITEHLDTWTSAIKAKSSAGRGGGKKEEFYGIKKLRELILELAVRGLLVPQDPKDEPAGELLSKIKKEKARSIKEGTEKKGKPLPSITPGELPYELPNGWTWARLGAISIIERGGSPRPIQSYLTDAADGLNWIKIGDTDQGGKYIKSTGEKIRPEGLKKTRIVYPGDFLLTNSMSFGRPYITLIEGCIHDGWLRISPPKSLDKDYLYNLLSSPFVHNFFKASAAGAVVQNLNSEKVRLLPIPLPPLAEQQRIVAKVDELMTLCDQLEQRQEDNVRTHATLVETLLGALTAPSERGAFAEAWQRIAAHFDTIFTTESSIDQLKQTLLQLAVMGKLVEQDPEDEPIKANLGRITNAKDKLQKSGEIPKDKTLPPLTADELPFQVPKTWSWVKLASITELITKGSSPKWQGVSYVSENEGVLFITSENVGNYDLRKLDELKYVEAKFNEIEPRSILKFGDILMNLVGASIGRTAIYVLSESANINQAVALIRIVRNVDGVSPEFLLHYLNSPTAIEHMLSSRVTNAQPNISLTNARNFAIPLPPLPEQYRIVAKVDELMALCDRLKARLQSAQTTQLHLADSLVETEIH